ncbi:hypothetical protein [Marinobacter lutaoensis]|uniref:hypothetical protein n=1 Tax=Marinobacter lutaoensis TaxID=135739 RepID=UPI0015948D4C|nr:hypothetical protein [Marinobacter lutaoensis]NVD37190.1 hypothetical protein [Marinobacter lutaoensis]
MVFYAPASHAEVRKLSLVKVDFAKRVGDIVDGPQVSRGLVVLAAFNLFAELRSYLLATNTAYGNEELAFAKTFGGALSELIAASLKLSLVLGMKNNSLAGGTRMYRIAARPLDLPPVFNPTVP